MEIQVVSIFGYCEQCCYKYRGPYIFFSESFFWLYAQEWGCWIIWQFYIQFSEVPPYCFPLWLYQFTFPAKVKEGSLLSTSSTIYVICRLTNDGHSDWCDMVPTVVLICISLMISYVEHFFMCLLVFLGEMSIQIFCPFFNQVVGFFAFDCMSCLYILEISSFETIFSPSVGFLLVSFFLIFIFMISFDVQNLLSLIRSHWFIFLFISIALGD